jgi:hypothetical protein
VFLKSLLINFHCKVIQSLHLCPRLQKQSVCVVVNSFWYIGIFGHCCGFLEFSDFVQEFNNKYFWKDFYLFLLLCQLTQDIKPSIFYYYHIDFGDFLHIAGIIAILKIYQNFAKFLHIRLHISSNPYCNKLQIYTVFRLDIRIKTNRHSLINSSNWLRFIFGVFG